MVNYTICINNGVEAFGTGDQKTITVNESVKTADEAALAREIAHANPLIPEQVAKAVLENFCTAAAQKMSEGFAIQFKNGNDVAIRIYPDIHVKGGNINLQRAKELMPEDVTDEASMVEKAGDLVSKAGVTVRVKAECQQKFTDLLLAQSPSIQREDIIEKAKVSRVNPAPANNNQPENPNTGGNTGGNGGNGGNGDADGDAI